MTLLTAHKILIASAVLCFLFYAAWETQHALAGTGLGTAWRALASATGALALGIYLWRVWSKK